MNTISDIFSKLQYDDLKHAHTETVIPVTDDDLKRQYNNLEELKNERGQKINPISEQESNDKLKQNSEKENLKNTKRAYKLIQQQQHIENKSNEWWSKLKQLKD